MNKSRYTFVIDCIHRAGDMLIESRKRHFEIFSKNGNPRDLVTSVDIEVNDFILKEIKSAFPEDVVFSEETETNFVNQGTFWTIDPIDGTSNFARGIPHFAVVMSYVENGEVILGAVYNPITRELFSFNKGEGVYLNGEKISVSLVHTIEEAYVLLHIGRKEKLWDWGLSLQRYFLEKAKKTINLGSSALDLCFLAAGRVDVVIYGTLTTQDVAVALAIVREAGGEIYTVDGIPVELSSIPQTIIATSHKALFEEIKLLS